MKTPKPIKGYGYRMPSGALCGVFEWTRQAAKELLTGHEGTAADSFWIEYKINGWKAVRVTLSLAQ